MFQYKRKISFIDYYVSGIYCGNMGVLRQKCENDKAMFTACIGGISSAAGSRCSIYLVVSEKGAYEPDENPILKGKGIPEDGHFLGEVVLQKERGEISFIIKEETVPANCDAALYFRLSENNLGYCQLSLEREGNEEESPDEYNPAKWEKQNREERFCVSSGDKWKDICMMHPVFYPFADQGEFVILREKELLMIKKEYHHLMENSFLNHAYYRYRHIILGKYKEKADESFYVGAPGSFTGEEQNLAAAFGFIGYEFTGNLGYYLIPVEL
ncbi:MAG: hypothetical protein IJ291_01500 [Lachnospiraceae bacterium]|nr:hypothetical protein [Lachnospiraceae bacterium]